MLSKIKMAVLAIALVGAGFYVWTAERAKERAATYKAQLDVATETAEHNAEKARQLRAELERSQHLLSETRQERDRIDTRVERLRGELSVALQESPDEVQECLPVRLPAAVRERLYGNTEADTED